MLALHPDDGVTSCRPSATVGVVREVTNEVTAAPLCRSSVETPGDQVKSQVEPFLKSARQEVLMKSCSATDTTGPQPQD